MTRYRTLVIAPTLTLGLLCAAMGYAQMDDKYQPNAQSKKYPEGSAIERRVRMAAIAAQFSGAGQDHLDATPEWMRKPGQVTFKPLIGRPDAKLFCMSRSI